MANEISNDGSVWNALSHAIKCSLKQSAVHMHDRMRVSYIGEVIDVRETHLNKYSKSGMPMLYQTVESHHVFIT